MIVYLIKHKGADYWGNYRHSTEIEFSDGQTIYAYKAFHRLKDAKKYLVTLSHPEFYEIKRFTSKGE